MISYLSALDNLSFSSSSAYSMGFGQNTMSTAVSGQISIPGQTEASDPATIPGQSKTTDPSHNSAVSGQPDVDSYECQTCKNRKYQDGSNDPGVSFKTPTRLSPERAAFAIRAHEAEHVAHAKVKAQKEDQEIVSQSVSYRTGVCPECGRIYMAGGTTRTTFRSSPVVEEQPVEKGRFVDLSV